MYVFNLCAESLSNASKIEYENWLVYEHRHLLLEGVNFVENETIKRSHISLKQPLNSLWKISYSSYTGCSQALHRKEDP